MRSCVLDGEAIVVDERGLSVFDAHVIGRTIMPPSYVRSICSNSTAPTSARSRLSSARQRSPIYYAVSLTASPSTGTFSGDGAMIFKHACALGCEGIVSKRLGSSYRAGRVNYWIKVKNPAAGSEA